jgi:hypothetical protein
MAERDRPVEEEIDDGGGDESRRPGERRRQTEIFGAEISDPGVDEIAGDPDRREGGDLAAMRTWAAAVSTAAGPVAPGFEADIRFGLSTVP